jgi:hypothetical protein
MQLLRSSQDSCRPQAHTKQHNNGMCWMAKVELAFLSRGTDMAAPDPAKVLPLVF